MRLSAATLSLVGAALLLGLGQAFLPHPAAQAGDGTSYETITNQTIDCSTNPGYRNPYVAEVYQKSVNNQKTPLAAEKKTSPPPVRRPLANANACNSCHRDPHPTVGSGKPQARQASILVYNRLDKPVEIETRSSANKQWVSEKLQPRQIRKITYSYRGGEKRSPVYYLKYKGDPRKKVRKMQPIATPNPYLGNVYFFDMGDDRQVRFYQPGNSVTRRFR